MGREKGGKDEWIRPRRVRVLFVLSVVIRSLLCVLKESVKMMREEKLIKEHKIKGMVYRERIVYWPLWSRVLWGRKRTIKRLNKMKRELILERRGEWRRKRGEWRRKRGEWL